jgi:lipopolysaccharide export LptBFGC system permease protein LptF
MKKLKLTAFLVIFTIALALTCFVKAQARAQNMKTFFDSEVPGIKVQVNATEETQPTQNMTVVLNLNGQTNVYVKSLNLSIFGFVNGTNKILMRSIIDSNFSLNYSSKEYNRTFPVPEHVWDTTYGEIVLTYSAKYEIVTIDFDKLTLGFTMTHVKNVYLEELQNKLDSLKEKYQLLNNSYWQLNGTYWQLNATYESLNQTFWELQQNYTSLQQNYSSLKGSTDNTRTAATVLAITTVFFVATTIYMVMRRPKEY